MSCRKLDSTSSTPHKLLPQTPKYLECIWYYLVFLKLYIYITDKFSDVSHFLKIKALHFFVSFLTILFIYISQFKKKKFFQACHCFSYYMTCLEFLFLTKLDLWIFLLINNICILLWGNIIPQYLCAQRIYSSYICSLGLTVFV